MTLKKKKKSKGEKTEKKGKGKNSKVKGEKKAPKTKKITLAAGLRRHREQMAGHEPPLDADGFPNVTKFFDPNYEYDTVKPVKDKRLTQSEFFEHMNASVFQKVFGLPLKPKFVKLVLNAYSDELLKLAKKGARVYVPNVANIFVKDKPARPARKGINPFTKEEQWFAAKPASKSLVTRPVKAGKDFILLEEKKSKGEKKEKKGKKGKKGKGKK